MTRSIDPHAPPSWPPGLRCPPLRRAAGAAEPTPVKPSKPAPKNNPEPQDGSTPLWDL